MARKKDSPQKAALRELMGNYLKENNVRVRSLIFRLATLAYHRRILFTDFFSQSQIFIYRNWEIGFLLKSIS